MSGSDLSDAGRRRLLDEMTRRSLGRFYAAAFQMMHHEELVPGPHIDAMVYRLEQLARGDIKRLLITLPPRHGKSELTSQSFPAWLLGNDPTTKINVVSYGKDLSEPLVSKARGIVKHPSYRRLFPNVIVKPGKDRQDYFEVAGGGSVRAASKSGAMTGHGMHFMIVDDFHKAGEMLSAVERENAIETFRTTFVNRFDNLNDSRIVIVMQRLHEEDLAGWALRTSSWVHLNLPAIAEQDDDVPLGRDRIWHRPKGNILAPAIISASELEEQRKLLGPRHFGAQYQQNPIIADGGQIDWNWFGQYDERPERVFFHKMVQSIDPAATDKSTSDYSVGQTWGFRDDRWYLLDVFRVQATYTNLLERVLAWHKRWRTDALIIEASSIGHALWDQVRRAKLPGIIRAPSPKLSKLDRLAACTPQLQSGHFLLPASADWLPVLRHELLAFPDGRNDDHVDALSQFVEFAFDNDRWVRTQYTKTGRPMNTVRPRRRSRYYDGDIPSGQSWQSRPDEDDE